jgi:small subunit ribosomal protein S20
LPITKSAKKDLRKTKRRTLVNKAIRSKAKTMITKAENQLAAKDEAAGKSVIAAISALDKAAEKGMIHPNNAARRKSRLMKKANKAAPEKKPS